MTLSSPVAIRHLVRSYGLKQKFIAPHCPRQNGIVERVIRTLKEQGVHRHRFKISGMTTASSGTGTGSTAPAARIGRTPGEPFRPAA